LGFWGFGVLGFWGFGVLGIVVGFLSGGAYVYNGQRPCEAYRNNSLDHATIIVSHGDGYPIVWHNAIIPKGANLFEILKAITEASGLTKNLDSKVMVDSATAGFGQGIAITPIQTIRALAVLGNGGKLVTPHIVDSILYQNGDRKKIVEETPDQVIKPETSERISRMLVHVVDTALMHGADKMDHYSIAAKTGTAQMVQPGKGYYEDRYLHSFFGYFPAYEPKYIIFLFHTYPKGAQYASATLTDPFFKLVKFLISYYQVPPDR
jgi:cell division protein FtsI/penicillin-binding protein 2